MIKKILAFLLENSCSESSTLLETIHLQNSWIALLLTSHKLVYHGDASRSSNFAEEVAVAVLFVMVAVCSWRRRCSWWWCWAGVAPLQERGRQGAAGPACRGGATQGRGRRWLVRDGAGGRGGAGCSRAGAQAAACSGGGGAYAGRLFLGGAGGRAGLGRGVHRGDAGR
jgi:hypothetical protein